MDTPTAPPRPRAAAVAGTATRPLEAGDIGVERREIECEPVADPAPARPDPAPAPPAPAQPAPA